MYHAAGSSIITLLLYLLSYLFFRTGFYSRDTHRKFWNIILLIAFLMTVPAGFFLSLQATYKWDIPIVKEILGWHVEAGIVLAVTATLHLIWHIKYYFRNTAGKTNRSPDSVPEQYNIKLNLAVTGFVSTSVQILLMREILNITGGYELITGAFLASWLTGSSAGAKLAGKAPGMSIRRMNLFFALSPLVSLLLMALLFRLFLNPGQTPSFIVSLLLTLVILFPPAMISSFVFSRLMMTGIANRTLEAGKSFSAETIGGVVSGLLITVLAATGLGTYKLLLINILLALILPINAYFLGKKASRTICYFILIALSAAVLLLNPDRIARNVLMSSVKVIDTQDTPYGNVTTARYGNEVNIYYNNRLLNYNEDVTEREEDIHYAMLQLQSPSSVVIISGSLSSHLGEINKYKVSKVRYVENDPVLARYEQEKLQQSDLKTDIINADPFNYFSETNDSADVVFQLLPPPSTLQLNRYYSSEFFSKVKGRLRKNGIFVCSTGPGDNYMNPEYLMLNSSVIRSLFESFRYVVPVRGNKLYLLASDNQLSTDITRLAREKHIETTYVNDSYLDDRQIKSKSEEIRAALKDSIKSNTMLFPRACFWSQSYLLSKTGTNILVLLVIIVAVLLIPAITLRHNEVLMFFTAAALAASEACSIISVQMIAGNIYLLNGIIIAVLMGGLASGAGNVFGISGKTSLNMKVAAMIGLYIVAGLINKFAFHAVGKILPVSIILILLFTESLITGNIFNTITSLHKSDGQAATTYSADLSGSALGFILISGLIIPLTGIGISSYTPAALAAAGIIFGTLRRKL